MLECWESLFHSSGDGRQSYNMCQTQISHYCASHQSTPLIMTVNICHNKYCHAIWISWNKDCYLKFPFPQLIGHWPVQVRNTRVKRLSPTWVGCSLISVRLVSLTFYITQMENKTACTYLIWNLNYSPGQGIFSNCAHHRETTNVT